MCSSFVISNNVIPRSCFLLEVFGGCLVGIITICCGNPLRKGHMQPPFPNQSLFHRSSASLLGHWRRSWSLVSCASNSKDGMWCFDTPHSPTHHFHPPFWPSHLNLLTKLPLESIIGWVPCEERDVHGRLQAPTSPKKWWRNDRNDAQLFWPFLDWYLLQNLSNLGIPI